MPNQEQLKKTFEDCRANFDFKHLFIQITRGITVKARREATFDLKPIRFIRSTNHAISGESNTDDLPF